jgi:hypothetical protein
MIYEIEQLGGRIAYESEVPGRRAVRADLGNLEISERQLTHLKELAGLRELYLGYTNIDDQRLANLTWLTELRLWILKTRVSATPALCTCKRFSCSGY